MNKVRLIIFISLGLCFQIITVTCISAKSLIYNFFLAIFKYFK